MTAHAYSPASSAIRSLRVQTLLDEVPKTKLAQELGVNRATISKYLKSDDMSLDMFLSIAKAANVDPIKILSDAIAQNKKASAGTDAQSTRK